MEAVTNNLEDYSASSTIIKFDRPLPLLREPIRAGLLDDSSGPFVLAFKDASAWSSAFGICKLKVIEQCEAGARIGCAITASNKCKPPWWRSLIGRNKSDFKERESCEEREMAVCVAASKEACLKFAKDKCLPPFRDARIAVSDHKLVSRLVNLVCLVSPESLNRNVWLNLIGLNQSCPRRLCSSNLEATTYRGSALLESEGSRN